MGENKKLDELCPTIARVLRATFAEETAPEAQYAMLLDWLRIMIQQVPTALPVLVVRSQYKYLVTPLEALLMRLLKTHKLHKRSGNIRMIMPYDLDEHNETQIGDFWLITWINKVKSNYEDYLNQLIMSHTRIGAGHLALIDNDGFCEVLPKNNVRFWVLNGFPDELGVEMLNDFDIEINAFYSYLKSGPVQSERRGRLWFASKDLATKFWE